MKKRSRPRILSRARKECALNKDPHLRRGGATSPLQGEGKELAADLSRSEQQREGISNEISGGERQKEGISKRARKKSATEGEAGKPKRVPIEAMHPGKIKKLPPDLREQLDKMLSEGAMHTCRQLSKWLGANGFRISHAAIHKYGQKFEHQLQAIKLATEQARIVCEEFKDDESKIQTALLRLVQAQLFKVLSATHGEGSKGVIDGPVAQVNLGALARTVSGLVKAETEHRKWVEHMRAGVAEAEKKVEEARGKGLSKDAADQIKAVLLEI
jgi:hypothetical protein